MSQDDGGCGLASPKVTTAKRKHPTRGPEDLFRDARLAFVLCARIAVQSETVNNLAAGWASQRAEASAQALARKPPEALLQGNRYFKARES